MQVGFSHRNQLQNRGEIMKVFLEPVVSPVDNKAMGSILHELRRKSGYTAEDVCYLLGLESPRAIYKWENGQSRPSYEHLWALSSRVYHVSLDSLFSEAGESCDSPVALLKRIFEFLEKMKGTK